MCECERVCLFGVCIQYCIGALITCILERGSIMSSNKKSIPAALGEREGTIGLRVYTKRVHHVVIIHLLTYRLICSTAISYNRPIVNKTSRNEVA